MLHITPLGIPIVTWAGMGWLALVFFLCGIAGALVVPFVVNALDNTRGARARKAAATPAEALRKIGELSTRLVDSEDRRKTLEK